MAEEQDATSNQVVLGLEENVAGALCYLFGFVTGIIFYLLEEENKFVRFHAVQSTIVFGALFILNWILGSLAIGLFLVGSLFALLSQLILVIALILWVVLMIKAYQGEMYKLPVVGDWAEDYA